MIEKLHVASFSNECLVSHLWAALTDSCQAINREAVAAAKQFHLDEPSVGLGRDRRSSDNL